MADETDIELREGWGAKIVHQEEDEAAMAHRWLFDLTDDGKWVCLAEVIHYDEQKRHYVPDREMCLPPDVQTFLQDECGVETVVMRGDVL